MLLALFTVLVWLITSTGAAIFFVLLCLFTNAHSAWMMLLIAFGLLLFYRPGQTYYGENE